MLLFCFHSKPWAQISIPNSSFTHTENFNTLASSGLTNTAVPSGWAFVEQSNYFGANTSYRAGDGSTFVDYDTYSFGANASTERAFGAIKSTGAMDTLWTTIGVCYTNNTGLAITSLTVTYTGETWAVGGRNRSDGIQFQYNQNTTGITGSGTWIPFTALDYFNPGFSTTGGGSMRHSAVRSATITGMNIPPGATFCFRWIDFDAPNIFTGAQEDGIGIDDYSLSNVVVITPITLTCANQITPVNCPATPIFNPPTVSGGCSTPSVTFSDSTMPGCSAGTYSVTRTWTATDNCGQSVSCSRTIVVQDVTAPTVTAGTIAACYPTVAAAEAAAIAATTATDGCSGVVKTASTMGTCSAVITVTGADGCNNSASVTYNTRIDNTPPMVVCKNATVIIQSQGGYTLQAGDVFNATASSDNCPGALTVTNISPATVNCSQINQTIPVTVTVKDVCGNTATCIGQVTVQQGTGLPAGWTATNIGAAAQGTSSSDPCDEMADFTLQANGYTTNTTDVQHAVYQNLCGDSEITAHVASLAPGAGWAGIQMRETTAQGSKKFTLKTQLSTILRKEIRTVTSGVANTPQSFIPPTHTWLRLTRTGSLFNAFSSPDGVTWAFRGSATIVMNSCIQVGLFVESFNNTTTTQAMFDQVSTSGGIHTLAQAPYNQSSTEAWEDNSMTIFPNPSSGIAQVTFGRELEQPAVLVIYNVAGEQVWQQSIGANTQNEQIDLSTLPNGLYWLRALADGSATPMVQRLVLQR
ncbi:MAG: T9SS type A sorting domain-containing protein [Saprospiraceae bacterium]|nr:T9SS type A sorting domain-containing protein [Saprospiraceae bacterium]